MGTVGWWKEGSTCDKVKGQDSSTLPPGLTREDKLDVFVDLMCRGMPMEFEQVGGIWTSLSFLEESRMYEIVRMFLELSIQ